MDALKIVLEPAVYVLILVIKAYIFIVIARALISWVNPDPYNPIVRFLHNVTEPVLYQIRRFIPVHFGGIDLTPMILILALIFLQGVLENIYFHLKF